MWSVSSFTGGVSLIVSSISVTTLASLVLCFWPWDKTTRCCLWWSHTCVADTDCHDDSRFPRQNFDRAY